VRPLRQVDRHQVHHSGICGAYVYSDKDSSQPQGCGAPVVSTMSWATVEAMIEDCVAPSCSTAETA